MIQLNEAAVKNHLGQIIRSTVEQTLNAMLGAEADRLCHAEKHQRNEATDTRAGHYQRTRQSGFDDLVKVITGMKFKDCIEVAKDNQDAA